MATKFFPTALCALMAIRRMVRPFDFLQKADFRVLNVDMRSQSPYFAQKHAASSLVEMEPGCNYPLYYYDQGHLRSLLDCFFDCFQIELG